MNSPIPQILLPPVASLDVPEMLNIWAQNLNRTLSEFIQKVTVQFNSQVQGVGLTLASDFTLMPTHPIHKVSGSHSPVRSIHAPPGFTGPLFLIPLGGWGWNTSENIGLSGTAVVGKLLIMVYDGQTWYPSYT